MALKYKRILLKISGEALGGEKGMGFDEPTMDAICGGVKKAHELGVQIGIVVGGGNFWRGRSSGKMERTLADKIGMLATVMNALAVSDKLEQLGVPTEVFTSITMPQVAPAFTRKDALRAMDEGKIAVFGGGTGNPFFSTDTATALRAVEVSADVMFKATMVDGVYDKDPHKYPDAKKYDTLTFTKVLEDQLAAKAVAGEIRPEDINEQMMSDAMYTAGQKDPDFILRPSGEKRLSNFMLWQAAYSELVEMDVLWPDFTRADLDTAIEEFNHRSRRFGGI